MLRATTRFAELARHVFLYNGTAMAAAAIACLALAILFILLLHIYAKRLLQAHSRLRSSSPEILSSSRRFAERATGLDDSVVASIPIFLYNSTEHRNQYGSECVVCLSEFEEDEVGRALPECGHCFHVECIDMWLYSHSNCPICRAPVVSDNNVTVKRERKALQLASRSFDYDCP